MKFIKIKYPEGDFEMQETPVTQSQWKKIMGSKPSTFKGAQHPVEMVSFNDVQKFIKKLNTGQNKYTYRLPTDEEWVRAFGKDLKSYDEVLQQAWCYENSKEKTYPVKKKKPNEHGFYDMRGNVWEWIDSSFGSYRVIRGGSWGDFARNLRSANHYYAYPGNRYDNVGFRLVRTSVSLDSLTLSSSKSETREALAEAKKLIEKAMELLK